jgi:hypothetical protein
MRLKSMCIVAILGLALLSAPAWGQEKEKAPAPPVKPAKTQAPQIEAATTKNFNPKDVVRRMCDYLKSLKEFSFKGEVTDDHTFAGGRKLQYAFDMEGYVKRPDKIRLNAQGDLENKQFFYDGKTITIYDTAGKVYASMSTPPTIDAALDKANQEYGLRLILAAIAKTNLYNQITRGVTSEYYAGEGTVFGVKCQHVAFDKGQAIVQLWVEASDKPVLRKVIITYTNVDFSPQWTAYFTQWNVSPQLADNLFVFTPPQGAEKIDFLPVKKAEAPKKGKGQAKKKGGQS